MLRICAFIAALGAGAPPVSAFEEFDPTALTRWGYVADRVMGGVSDGGARLADGVLRMVGEVSTANNGGFIQVRRGGFEAWPVGAEGLRLEVKGNGEAYYVFLRTPGLWRPGWSYRARFETSAEWQVVTLPFAGFAPSSGAMPQAFSPADVVSIGIVAYGRDHVADVSVRRISVY